MPRSVAALLVLAVIAPAALAHGPGSPSAASPLRWNLEPWLLASLAAAALLYAAGCARLWRRAGAGRGITPAQAARFWAGWGAVATALVSPIDALGAHLFSAHMVQHELLMVVAAPLLVTGRPLQAWTWALPPGWRTALGAAARLAWLRAPWAALTHPFGAWIAHAAALWLWHVPAFFEASLASRGLHELQHASFFGSALLLWWSVLGRRARRPDAASLGSLVTTMLHTGALGALLTFAPGVWYASYRAGNAYGLAPLDDQQLGGLVMWAPGGLAYLLAGLAIVSSWLRSSPAAASPWEAETRGPGPAASARPE